MSRERGLQHIIHAKSICPGNLDKQCSFIELLLYLATEEKKLTNWDNAPSKEWDIPYIQSLHDAIDMLNEERIGRNQTWDGRPIKRN